MHEGQAVEGMLRVVDRSMHVHAADRAGVALNGLGRIDHFQLLAVGEHLDLGVGTTAIIEKSAPAGLQHCEQPQT